MEEPELLIALGGGVIGDLAGFTCGTYVHKMRRRSEGWKISACAFVVAGYPGGRAAFDEAFAAARAVQVARGTG